MALKHRGETQNQKNRNNKNNFSETWSQNKDKNQLANVSNYNYLCVSTAYCVHYNILYVPRIEPRWMGASQVGHHRRKRRCAHLYIAGFAIAVEVSQDAQW